MSRLLIIATLLGASIGVPYVMSQSNGSRGANGAPSSPWPTGDKVPPVSASTQQTITSVSPSHGSIAPLPPGTSCPTMEQVFRFDITKNWVYQRWARKSTSPTEFNLFAVRVALVTGTQPGSVAGSLTYFFNAADQVEHISFRGRTGNAAPFVQFMTKTYEFRAVQAPVGEQLYQVARGGGVQSELRIRPEGILVSTAPQSSLSIELELARPGSTRLLPPRGPALQIPPDATPTPSAASGSAAKGTGAPAAAGEKPSTMGSYFDKVRYASPEEIDQVLWKRWPN